MLTVNSLLDNATPGDGLATLREAIIAANTNATTDLGHTGTGADAIEFAPSVAGTIALQFGELIITESLTINGPGRDVLTIDAGRNSRIFNVTAETGEYTFRSLILTGGSTASEGGAIRVDFATTLTIDQCRIRDNTAVVHGGGIYYSATTMTMTHSIVTGNSATGPNARGGGFFGPPILTNNVSNISNSLIDGNSATEAGGGFCVASNLNLTNSVISDNRSWDGGGFFLTGGATFRGENANITSSTITNNRASGSGGGFAVPYLTATDCIITDNSAGGAGGGFLTFNTYPRITPATVIGTTVLRNRAMTSGGGFFAHNGVHVAGSTISENIGGGIFARNTISINASTVSNNIGFGPGGGIHSGGSSSSPVGTLVGINSSVVTGNKSPGKGGGIYSRYRGPVELGSSTVSNNESVGSGGGIFGGAVTLRSSTVSGNTSGAAGGGIDGTTISVTSSTVSGNIAATGGGIYSSASNSFDIKHSTITRNVATTGAGGGVWSNNRPIKVAASIVARNTAGAGNPDLRPGSGTLTILNSLIGDNAGTSLIESHAQDAKGNLIGSAAGNGIIDPRLAPLASNGGPTQTHALLPGSPAIDTIPVPVPPTSPAAAHDYQLDGSLADALGGPSLVSHGGRLESTHYAYDANEGLSLSNALANPGRFSIEIMLGIDWGSFGWNKIVDFKDLSANAGLYRGGTALDFRDRASVPNGFPGDNVSRLILTRDDTTNIVRAFVNASERWNFVDNAGEAVFDGPGQIIRFFQDDTTTGQSEAGRGWANFIRIYDRPLTTEEIEILDTPPPVPLPDFDQRGAGFVRVVEGDGVEGPRLDMGAYEAQEVPIFATGDYNQNGIVDAADYVIWRKTLSSNVPNGTGADGNGDGVVNADDHGVWRTNFGRTQAPDGAGAALRLAESSPQSDTVSRVDVSIVSPSPGAAAIFQSSVSQSNRSLPTLQPPSAAAELRDDAFLAWTSARSARRGQLASIEDALNHGESRRAQPASRLSELWDGDLSFELLKEIDRAIELLAAQRIVTA